MAGGFNISKIYAKYGNVLFFIILLSTSWIVACAAK